MSLFSNIWQIGQILLMFVIVKNNMFNNYYVYVHVLLIYNPIVPRLKRRLL